MSRMMNSRVEKCGLCYAERVDACQFIITGKDWGSALGIDRMSDFIKVFPEYDWSNGLFVQDIAGAYVQVILDDNGRAIGIANILDSSIVYMFEEETHESTDDTDGHGLVDGGETDGIEEPAEGRAASAD